MVKNNENSKMRIDDRDVSTLTDKMGKKDEENTKHDDSTDSLPPLDLTRVSNIRDRLGSLLE